MSRNNQTEVSPSHEQSGMTAMSNMNYINHRNEIKWYILRVSDTHIVLCFNNMSLLTFSFEK